MGRLLKVLILSGLMGFVSCKPEHKSHRSGPGPVDGIVPSEFTNSMNNEKDFAAQSSMLVGEIEGTSFGEVEKTTALVSEPEFTEDDIVRIAERTMDYLDQTNGDSSQALGLVRSRSSEEDDSDCSDELANLNSAQKRGMKSLKKFVMQFEQADFKKIKWIAKDQLEKKSEAFAYKVDIDRKGVDVFVRFAGGANKKEVMFRAEGQAALESNSREEIKEKLKQDDAEQDAEISGATDIVSEPAGHVDIDFKTAIYGDVEDKVFKSGLEFEFTSTGGKKPMHMQMTMIYEIVGAPQVAMNLKVNGIVDYKNKKTPFNFTYNAQKVSKNKVSVNMDGLLDGKAIQLKYDMILSKKNNKNICTMDNEMAKVEKQ